MQNKTYNLYPEVNNFEKFTLKAGNLHEIYYEVCGNPNGSPVVFYMVAQAADAALRNVAF